MDSTVCSVKNTNGMENEFIDSVSDKPVYTEKCTRHSGIPRLVSSPTHRYRNIVPCDENSFKTTLPKSPSHMAFQGPKLIDDCEGNQCCDGIRINDTLISPIHEKKGSRDILHTSPSVNIDHKSRPNTKTYGRHDRAVSEEHHERKSVESSFSELTNNSGSTGPTTTTHVITSKIGSFANARYKPGGGNVKIIEKKVDFSNVEARCGSKKNIKYKPGGGDVEIINRRLEFSKTAAPKVNSLKNIKYQPQGGDVKIDDRKLEWNTNSKVGSLNNIKHKPGGGDVQIVTQQLPWLKHNKPNLPPEEIAKIEKRSYKSDSSEMLGSPPLSYSNSQCSDRSH